MVPDKRPPRFASPPSDTGLSCVVIQFARELLKVTITGDYRELDRKGHRPERLILSSGPILTEPPDGSFDSVEISRLELNDIWKIEVSVMEVALMPARLEIISK